MIGQRYREKKTAVLDVVRRYLEYRGTTEDGVNRAFVELRVDALEKGQYVLAIVGEAKAGKSTLINALLGESILPTDVLQSSSAIVEIFKSEKKFVEVRYADGHSEEVHDEAYELLRRIGALQDRFRGIPTALIDAYIAARRIEAGGPIPWAALEAESKLPLGGEKELIEEYVRERTLADIPVEIRFGFPLKYAFDELRIVDTPGVNAVGGVQGRTFEYLHNANAVLFVHSLEGPVENSSFREFITQVAPNRMKQALFLVLSKSGFKSDIEIDEKVREAKSLFCEEFDPDHILHVDSMLKIVADELMNFDSAAALKEHYLERKKYFEKLLNETQPYQDERRQVWRDEAVKFDTKLKLLNNTIESLDNRSDREIVRSALRRASNFDQLEHAINEFSALAADLQLSELLTSVKRGYENQLAALEQNLDLLTKKRKSPQTFESEISEIQRQLKEYEREQNEFAESLFRRYTGVKAESSGALNDLKSKYIEAVTQAPNESAVRKAVEDFNDEGKRLVDAVTGRIREESEAKLAKLGAEFKARHKVTVPVVDVTSLVEKAEESAFLKAWEVHDTTDRNAAIGGGGGAVAGATIGSFIFPGLGTALGALLGSLVGGGLGAATGELKHEFSEDKYEAYYIEDLRSGATAEIERVSEGEIPDVLSTVVQDFVAAFKAEIRKLVASRSAALEEIKTQKSANEEILRKIASAEQKKKAIGEQLRSIHEMLENLR